MAGMQKIELIKIFFIKWKRKTSNK